MLASAASTPVASVAAPEPHMPSTDERGLSDPVVIGDGETIFAGLSPAKVRALKAKGLVVEEEAEVRMMRVPPGGRFLRPPRSRGTRLAHAGQLPLLRLKVVCADAASGLPIAGAAVSVGINVSNKHGFHGITDAAGVYVAVLPNRLKRIDYVAAAPLAGYWAAQTGVVKVTEAETTVSLALRAVDPQHRDPHEMLLHSRAPNARGQGIRVAVIDGGVTPPVGLKFAAGLNTTVIEDPLLVGDNGTGHGTHVATTIARIAPDAEIVAYRVFPQGKAADAGGGGVVTALRDAVKKGCHLVNLSLGYDNSNLAIAREVRVAMNAGVLCIAAAGNDWGADVTYPARLAEVIAAAASGVAGTWPTDVSLEHLVAEAPPAQGDAFFAAFSNRGDSVDAIAPGVAILSHVDASRRGVMDGTSMATPFVTGALAALLSADPSYAVMAPDAERYRAARAILTRSLRPIGFGDTYEGGGQPHW